MVQKTLLRESKRYTGLLLKLKETYINVEHLETKSERLEEESNSYRYGSGSET